MDQLYWQTEEEVTRDLYEYSGLEYPQDSFSAAPPKSIAEYKARTSEVKTRGLFDDIPEDSGIFVSGRGKYQIDRIIRPGFPMKHIAEDDTLLQKKIREVSGLGYGNDMIEEQFRCLDLKEEYSKKMECLKEEALIKNEIMKNSFLNLSPQRSTSQSSPTNRKYQRTTEERFLYSDWKEEEYSKKLESSKEKAFTKGGRKEDSFLKLSSQQSSRQSSPTSITGQPIVMKSKPSLEKKPEPPPKKNAKKKKFIKWSSNHSDNTTSVVNEYELWRTNFTPKPVGNCIIKGDFPILK